MDSESDLSIFKAFEDRPNIKNTKNKNIGSAFTFEITYPDVVMKIIINLNITKNSEMYDIPTKVVKINKVIFAIFITELFNYCITSKFPYELEHLFYIHPQK